MLRIGRIIRNHLVVGLNGLGGYIDDKKATLLIRGPIDKGPMFIEGKFGNSSWIEMDLLAIKNPMLKQMAREWAATVLGMCSVIQSARACGLPNPFECSDDEVRVEAGVAHGLDPEETGRKHYAMHGGTDVRRIALANRSALGDDPQAVGIANTTAFTGQIKRIAQANTTSFLGNPEKVGLANFYAFGRHPAMVGRGCFLSYQNDNDEEINNIELIAQAIKAAFPEPIEHIAKALKAAFTPHREDYIRHIVTAVEEIFPKDHETAINIFKLIFIEHNNMIVQSEMDKVGSANAILANWDKAKAQEYNRLAFPDDERRFELAEIGSHSEIEDFDD